MSDQDNILDALIQALSTRRKEQQQHNNALPVPYHPANSLPSTSRPGFLARMFDPSAAMKMEFEQKQLQLTIETRLKAMNYEAHGYAETIRIDQEQRVRLHEQERREQEDVQKRYAKARAEIQKHLLQQNLMTELADYNLDPMEEQLLIAKIVRIMMTPNGTESSNGKQ